MAAYYVLKIDSLIESLTLFNSASGFTFSLDASSEKIIARPGDLILGNVSEPTNEVRYLFEVVSADVNKLVLKKKLESLEGVAYDFSSLPDVEVKFFPISEEIFLDVLSKLAKIVLPFSGENTLKQAFPETALQVIFYGCPGTGKSHELNKITDGYDVIRTTFHPNSDYATFVGAYKPVETIVPKTMTIWDSALNQAIEHPVVTSGGAAAVEKKITYQFVQQAFLKAYVEAWKKLSCSRILAGGASVTAPTSLSKIASSATSPYSSTSPGVPDPDNFEFSVEHGMDLSDDGRGLLAAIDAFNFPIIGCFKDVHDKIELVISDRGYFEGLLPDLHYSKKELQERLDKINKQLKVEKDQNRTRELLGILGSIKDYLSNDTISRGEKPLLGLYVSEEKKVYLFKENILDAAGDSEDSDEYKLYLASTYIHEMFHAFYDKSNVIPEIEEAIVEASTLCFLEKFRPDYASRYYSIVSRKYYRFPEYAFGAFLFDHRSVDWIKLYNDAHTISPNAPLVKKYCHGVLNHRFFLREEKEDLKNILFTILTSPAPTVVPDEMNKQDVQFLVIEEINRGDCAQIFGDIFQLLDRNDYGFSSYPIEPDSDIQRALKESFEGISIPDRVDKMYKPLRSGKISDGIKEGRLMLLPSNLFIYATMNTSDQSLFPMDSAFKRRWDWRYFAIKDEGKGYQLTLDGKSYEWWKLLEELNRRILELTHSSDKQMGYWFIKLPEGVTEIPVETFVSKVIFYLWNDVFKDYAQDGGNPFTDETRFEKFYDGEGNVQNEVLKVFLENLFKEKASDENPE